MIQQDGLLLESALRITPEEGNASFDPRPKSHQEQVRVAIFVDVFAQTLGEPMKSFHMRLGVQRRCI